MFRPGLLGLAGTSAEDLLGFLQKTKKVRQTLDMRGEVEWLKGKIVTLFFLEDSTRTRMSFEFAARRLGASVSLIQASGSSLSKGESIIDTVKNLQALQPHAIVIRTPVSGIPQLLQSHVLTPIINAGDGFHEHPTQALLDLFTIKERFDDFKGLKVCIVGDIAHSRVARSNIAALVTLGARVTVCAPPTMIPPQVQLLGVEVEYNLSKAIQGAQVVMMLRIQQERHLTNHVPSAKEYAHFFGFKSAHLPLIDSKGIIMHPGPVNRGIEIDSSVLDGDRSVVLSQVENGIAVRALVLTTAILKEVPYELH